MCGMDKKLQIHYVSLVTQAIKAKQAGDVKQAKALMDEAIQIINSIGKENPDLYIFREMLLTDFTDIQEINWDKVKGATEAAYEFYEQEKDIAGQIDSIIQLASISLASGKKEVAQKYIDEAHNLINNTDPEVINKNLPEWSLLSGESFLHLRQAEVNRLHELAT